MVNYTYYNPYVEGAKGILKFKYVCYKMNFVKPYSLLETGNFDLRTGKKLSPHKNQHYASVISPVGKYSSVTEIIRTLPVPQATRRKRVD